MKTKFHKSVTWLAPFLKSVGNLVPTDRIKWVKGYSVPRGKKPKADAYIHMFGNHKTFHINLELSSIKKGKLISPYLYNFLDSFAHEIAHLIHWEHTAEHFKLKNQIQLKFVKVLKQLKIDDTYVTIDRMGAKNEKT
jgi:hypothetical protein